MGETRRLAEFVSSLEYEQLPEEAIETAKTAIRDYLGVAIYGSAQDTGEIIASYVEQFEPGTRGTIFGGGSASPTGAALANGVFGHAEDYDDSLTPFPDHPTSPIFPAAFAASELEDATGRELLAAYIGGVETMYRIEASVRPGHPDKGWHATGTVATFGAAAAAGSVFGFTVDELRTAFGIAASCSSSLFKNFGSMTKPYHAGHAAQMGIRAALLARRGFTADNDVLEGDQGYGRVMTDEGGYDPSEVTDGLGKEWAISNLGFKPYPSGRVTHAPMEALRRIVESHDLSPDDVETVTVTITEYSDNACQHRNPTNALQAKFSYEFCLAAVLRERRVGIHEFTDEFVARSETRAQMKKVKRDIVDELFGEHIGYGGRVTVELRDGTEITEEEPEPLGNPTNPMSEQRHQRKFYECASTRYAEASTKAIEEIVMTLDAEDGPERLRDAVRNG